LAALWAELLQLERVGRHDHFFELGGHSLLATQLLARMRRLWETEISLVDVFAHPRLARLAEVVVDRELAGYDADELATVLSELKDQA
ncbi:phosphopantetheine-binding protein, partial [Pelomonas sp. CA6]|uniref:phosphopantetheine-binding protein n=1 Tax=Pelomonas sp. CA6 TaxID=2907999 RepID=UPI0024082ECC